MAVRIGRGGYDQNRMMRIPTSRRDLLSYAAALAHVAIVLLVLAVPVNAVWHVVLGVLNDSTGGLNDVIDPVRWRTLLVNTSIVSAAAAATALAFGVSFGFLIGRTDLPGRRWLAGAALLGACVPLYVSVIFIFAQIPLWQYRGSALACGVMHGLVLAPLATLILAAVFRAADRELEDQARLECGDFAVFRRITLPHAGWGVAIAGMIVVLLTATDHTITDILIVRTFAEEVYTQFILDRSAAGPLLVGLPVTAALGAMLIGMQRRYRFFGENLPWHAGGPPRTFELGRWRLPVALAAPAVVLALMGPPAWALLAWIGHGKALGATIALLQTELWRTLLVAAAGATLIVIFAIGLAWTALRTRRLRWIVLMMIVVLLGLPAPVIGISLIELLNRPNWLGAVYDSPVAVVIGYVSRFLPLGVLLMLPAIQRVSVEHEQAARVDGCNWLLTQWHVYWPAARHQVAVVWLVLAILCFGEVAATVLVAPPGWPLASVRAYTLIHSGVCRDLAVLALLTIGYIILPWLLLVVLLRRRPAEA